MQLQSIDAQLKSSFSKTNVHEVIDKSAVRTQKCLKCGAVNDDLDDEDFTCSECDQYHR